MDPDESDSVHSGDPVGPNPPNRVGGDLPAPTPGGRAPTPGTAQGPDGASNVTTIAVAIIGSSVSAHSVIFTVVVAISIMAAIALERTVRR